MIKKFFLGVIIYSLSVTLSYAQQFSAVTPSEHILYYNIVGNEAEVTFCNYNYPNYDSTLNGDLIIPDSVMHDSVIYPVTTIGADAFNYATMRSVSIPNTVRTIMLRAFVACDSLTSLHIPNSVTSIGQQAFAGSFNIVSITLPDSLTTIEMGLFENDTSLLSVTIPDAVTTVDGGAFSQCYSLRSVTFGASVGSLGSLMFWNCYALDSLIFKSEVAPWVGANMFPGAPDTLTIDIPCGSYHSYLAAFGAGHHYIVPSVNLSMTVTSDHPEWGQAIVVQDADSHDVRCDSSSVVMATANYGYRFVAWNNGNTAAIDTLYLDRDSTLTAHFAKNRYTLVVSSNDQTIGTVSGGGEFDYLHTATIRATPSFHHHLVQWSDGNGDTLRHYVVTQDAVLTAYFAIDTYQVTIASANETQGSVYGSEGFSYGIGNFAYGTVATVMAMANEGYHFVRWNDGSTDNPYSFPVFADKEVIAEFAEGTEGVNDVEKEEVGVKVVDGRIFVTGLGGRTANIYDSLGRQVATHRDGQGTLLANGVYVVQIDGMPPVKVVVTF